MKKKTVIFVMFVILGATAAGLNSEGIQMVLNVDDRIVLPVPRHKALSMVVYFIAVPWRQAWLQLEKNTETQCFFFDRVN